MTLHWVWAAIALGALVVGSLAAAVTSAIVAARVEREIERRDAISRHPAGKRLGFLTIDSSGNVRSTGGFGE